MSEMDVAKTEMTKKATATIVLVDDEPAILRILSRDLHDLDAQMHAFVDAEAALEKLDEIQPDVVISDVYMPGMDGIEMMERVAQKFPLSERILLTGYADVEAAIGAINKGRIHYYLQKPWEKERLKRVVNKGIQLSELRQRNEYLERLTREQNEKLKEWNQLLERRVKSRTEQLRESYKTTVSVFSNLVEQRLLGLQSSNRRVANLCKAIGEKLGLNDDDLNSLGYAALMRNIGKVGFPDELLSTPYHAMTASQRQEYQQHPNLAAVSLAALHPLKNSAYIVASFCENSDGSGYPQQLKGSDIPVTASILAAVSDYYDAVAGFMLDRPLTETQARDWLVENRGRLYPTEVVDATVEVISAQLRDEVLLEGQELSLSTHALKDGMKLTRDLVSPAGVLLLCKGTLLDEHLIEHLVRLEQNGGQSLQLFVIQHDTPVTFS